MDGLGYDFDLDGSLEVNANKLKEAPEFELDAELGAGDAEADKHLSNGNGMDIDLEADFDAQLNDLNRSSAVGVSEPVCSFPEDEDSPTQNDQDITPEVRDEPEEEEESPRDMEEESPRFTEEESPRFTEEESPRDMDGGEAFNDADADIATEGSLDLDVDHGGDIATEGSLDLDIDIPDQQRLSDLFPLPHVEGMDLAMSDGEPEQPLDHLEMEPLQQLEPEPEPVAQDQYPQGLEEEQQRLLQEEGIVDNGLEAGAMTEGSLDLDVGGHVEDDDDADVFESNEKLDSPHHPAYINTTLISNASSSLGGHEPAPAHAQSLISPSTDDLNLNGDVMVVDRRSGSDRHPSSLRGEPEEITVIEPNTETKLLDEKGNGDVFLPMPVPRKGFPPPFPIGYSDENLHKGNWGHKMEFMCAIFCVVFNIDSFVRFPYIMYANGGVVFLIPYMIALFLLILPLLLMEISLGQFCSSSIFTCWKFCPLIKGLSVGMLLQLLGFAFLWGPFGGHSVYYIYTVFLPGPTDQLIYSSCSNDWNSNRCNSLFPPVIALEANGTGGNYTTVGPYDSETSSVDDGNVTGTTMPEEEFYRNHVKMQAGSTEQLDYPIKHLMISLAVTWVVVFHIILFGIKSFGKVAYLLASAHIVLLLVLLIRGAILEGALDGIKFLFWPDVYKLLDVKVWSEAFQCAMYTFAPMCGIFMSLSSYNKFHNNCFMDSVVLILVTLFVNLLSAVTFFTYIGYGGTLMKKSVVDFLDRTASVEKLPGQQLLYVTNNTTHSTGDTIFVLMAMIFSTLPHARIMSFLLFFFSFLSTLAFQAVVALSMVIAFLDVIGCRHSWKTIIPASFLITVVCFGGGLLFITPEGPYFWTVVYRFFLPHIPFILSVILPLALTWIYGTIPAWRFLKFQRDIKAMVGCFPIVFQGLFAGLEAAIIPIAIGVGWVYNLYLVFRSLDLDFQMYQGWHVAVAIIMAFVPLIIGFLSGAVMELCKYISVYRYFTELFWLASMPLREWGPAVEEIRMEHDYPVVTKAPIDLVQEDRDHEFSHENVNNANDNSLRRSIGYSSSIRGEGSYPPSPREKQEIVFPSSNNTLDRDQDPAVNSNATLPAGTPLLGLSLCSHETTL